MISGNQNLFTEMVRVYLKRSFTIWRENQENPTNIRVEFENLTRFCRATIRRHRFINIWQQVDSLYFNPASVKAWLDILDLACLVLSPNDKGREIRNCLVSAFGNVSSFMSPLFKKDYPQEYKIWEEIQGKLKNLHGAQSRLIISRVNDILEILEQGFTR